MLHSQVRCTCTTFTSVLQKLFSLCLSVTLSLPLQKPLPGDLSYRSAHLCPNARSSSFQHPSAASRVSGSLTGNTSQPRRLQHRGRLSFREASAGLGMPALTLDLLLQPGPASGRGGQMFACLLSPNCVSPYKKGRELISP